VTLDFATFTKHAPHKNVSALILPWNAGRWRIGCDGVDRTDDAPALRCDVTALGSVYLGGFTWTRLARALRVQELASGAAAQADAIFEAASAPWCPEIF
jgi:predicted acetyltransferase